MSWDGGSELCFNQGLYREGNKKMRADEDVDNPRNKPLIDDSFDDVRFDSELPVPLLESFESIGAAGLPEPVMPSTMVESNESTTSWPYSGIFVTDIQPSMPPCPGGENQMPPNHNINENELAVYIRCQSEEVNCCDSSSANLSRKERHNLTEKRRRERVNDYLKYVGVLTHCPQSDAASILQTAINFVKIGKLTLENYSMRVAQMRWPCMSTYVPIMETPDFTQAQMENPAALAHMDPSLYSNQMQPDSWNPTAESGNLYNGQNFNPPQPAAWNSDAEDGYFYNSENFGDEFPDFGPLNM